MQSGIKTPSQPASSASAAISTIECTSPFGKTKPYCIYTSIGKQCINRFNICNIPLHFLTSIVVFWSDNHYPNAEIGSASFATTLNHFSGLLKPWGQYIRTVTDGKMKGDAGAERKSREVHAQKEELRSRRQVHHAPRTQELFGVPKQAPTVCHDLRSHDYYPEASHSTRSLWVSVPTAR